MRRETTGSLCYKWASLPGLTRQSIDLRKNFLAKEMDARVKPAHDELAKQLKLS
jgi:hypothetical protein